ncbi:hypothetical protein C8P66_11525 [Humitalea rosea]|uniref:Uncharacterized protein n=1 Tax=Humitalea rosea TaxID=990373 RepID=A0A2W7IA53_9PROT|nr:hypothetical protein [Humitalea rosea]PZW43564.1 hypothetical protein C8P66_11525 [Humitalea rosea]
MRHAALLLLFLAGCTAPPRPGPAASLPEASSLGMGDPTRAAIVSSAWAFADPANLAGQPAEAAAAVARLEYLATEIPVGPRWVEISPLAAMDLQRGVGQARTALGIPADAPPQAVIDALFAARAALLAGQATAAEAALPAATFPAGGRVTLVRLGNLPALPAAAAGAQAVQHQMDRNGGDNDNWDD